MALHQHVEEFRCPGGSLARWELQGQEQHSSRAGAEQCWGWTLLTQGWLPTHS